MMHSIPGLMESETFVFHSTTRHDIATLSGDLEGFYGAVAANYLKGIIDMKLNTIGTERRKSWPTGSARYGRFFHTNCLLAENKSLRE